MNHFTSSDQETIELGKEIAKKLQPGDIVLLYGELGAGKTTLVKGIALGLGVEDEILSPTFTLMNLYQIRNQKSEIENLIHVDTYRLRTEEELIKIGFEDYLGADDTITIIEWPEKLLTLLKDKKTIDIHLSHDEEGRNISTTLAISELEIKN